jgi:octaprenyl-diphosphate synthase
MTQGIEAALTSLQLASSFAEDGGLEQRLADAQSVLRDDLAWVERALADVAAEGPSPGVDASRYMVSLGGKRVRPMALLLSSACFGPVPAASRQLAVAVELVHSATLLHDDVIDDGGERRGRPAARVVWGNAVSVLSGDLLLTHALMRAQKYAPSLMNGLLATLQKLVHGEIVQLRGRAELEVSEQAYHAILRDKTASLFRFSATAGAHLGGASVQHERLLGDFGESLGMAFQLVDDLLDYAGERTGKTMFSDLRQGKLTLPLVLAVREAPELIESLHAIRAGDESALAVLRERVIASGVCATVRTRARGYTSRAIEHLRHLPQSSARSLLEGVAQQLADRTG